MAATYAAHIVTTEANMGTPEVTVTTQADEARASDVIVSYPLTDQDWVTLLADNGWDVDVDDTQVATGYTIVTVEPIDIDQIVKHATVTRAAAAAEYERCDTGWRILIRDAMNGGGHAAALAAAAEVSRERVYQIRDGRR